MRCFATATLVGRAKRSKRFRRSTATDVEMEFDSARMLRVYCR